VEWIVRDAPLGAAGGGPPHVEPHLAANPTDPDHLVAASIVVGADGDPWHCAAFASFDRGESWSRTDFGAMERCIDPWVAVLPGDTALFAAIEIRSDGEGPDRFRLHLHRSVDGGRTWSSEPDTLGRRFEHPILAPGGPAHGGALYLGARLFARGSGDVEWAHAGWVGRLEGVEPTRARRTALIGPARDLIVTGVAPLPGGALVVSYRDFHGEVEGSADAAERARGWAARSEDGGRSFGDPVLVDGACASGGLARAFPGYPSAAMGGAEGPSSSRLYHACVRRSLEGVAVSRSTDGGRSWSRPVRVDRAGGDEGTPHARTPMVGAGPEGRVAVAWYDRRHDPDRACQEVYLAVSGDGGRRFSRPVRVTLRSSCPGAGRNGRAARSWPMGGDYGSLAAGPDGTFHLLWADSRSGVFALRRAAFRVAPIPASATPHEDGPIRDQRSPPTRRQSASGVSRRKVRERKAPSSTGVKTSRISTSSPSAVHPS